MSLRAIKQISAALIFAGVAMAGPVNAEAGAGAYLAARAAGFDRDFSAASRYFAESLRGDPTNAGLLDSAITVEMALGRLDAALPYAETMDALGYKSQNSSLVLMTDAAANEDWPRLFSQLEAGHEVGPLVDGLAQAWAYMGQGKVSRALETFDEVAETQGLAAFGHYHKALALASVGDFEGADAIFSMSPSEGMQRTVRSTMAHAEVLSQLDRGPQAVDMLQQVFGPNPDPAVARLGELLAEGSSVPFTFVKSPRDGVAEVFYTLANALEQEADASYVLAFSRAAEILRPEHSAAIILSGELLDSLGRYELANETFALVPSDDPYFYAAELGRSASLRRDGKMDAAIEVMQALTRTHPDLALVHASLGDLMRQDMNYAAAVSAYSTALDLQSSDDPSRWFYLYARAISFERQDLWDQAEADFRASLALRPDHPSVLNYLGYSLVEKQIKLDEALDMIERAVAAEPENGAIVDSLGWVLYRLGQYDEAIGHMERAASLEPVDPIINDHLGDVLWAVGRKTEARFQWQRALSFEPEEEDATRIRRKLEVGLDLVLEEEGAEPLSVASDDG